MQTLVAAASIALTTLFAFTPTASAGHRDHQAPTTPTGLVVTATTGTTVEIAWTPSTDNVGVDGYGVWVDGVPGWTPTPTYTAGGLTCGSQHTFQVAAFDFAGNESAVTTLAAATAPCTASPPPPPTGFVTRSGQQLLLDGLPYRFIGFNVWRANVTSWNKPPNTGYLVNDGTTLDTTLKSMDALGGMNVIRTWFFQQFANHNGAWDWSAFDKTLAVARANGFKVIATLADGWSYEGPPFRDAAWYAGGYKTDVAAPYELVPYREWVQTVVRRYASDPTIAAWELVNEPDVAVSEQQDGTCASDAGATLAAFVHDVGGLVKSIDPNHLLSLGVAGNGNCGTIEGDYATVMSDPSIDLCSFHDYYGAANASAYNTYNGLNVRVQQCNALDKPIYIGETGIHAAAPPCYGDLFCRSSYLSAKLASAFAIPGMVGYVPWQYDQRGGTSDDYVYGPTDPALGVLGSYGLP